MAIEKKLICFARLAEFERQLAAGNILEYSIVLIQDAKKIYNRGTYYDCNGGSSVYAWEWDGSEGGSFSQEEFNKMKSADIVVVKLSDQMYVADCSYAENSIQLLVHTGMTQMLVSQVFTISPEGWQLTETQVYTIPTKVSELDNDSKFVEEKNLVTINGQSLTEGGDIEIGADNVYITDFTVNDLLTLAAEEGVIHASIDMLSDALSAHKVILVPYDANEGFQGYAVANGYKEDLLYLTVALTDGWVDLELNHDLNEIRSYMVTLLNWSNKQDKLVSGTNIKTINGESILGEGDLTVEGGAKVYDWIPQMDEIGYINGTLTKDEFENIRDCDILLIGGMPCMKISTVDSILINMSTSSAGEDFSVGVIAIYISGTTYGYSGSVQDAIIPTKTSQLENDSNFVSSDGLKTINGESIVGSGNIEVGKTNYVELSGASVTISSMLENTFYYDTTPLTSLTISAFTSSGNPKDEYKAVFKAADGMSLTLPSDMYWANGTIPEIEADVFYELSIERSLDVYKAVLVPFKSV